MALTLENARNAQATRTQTYRITLATATGDMTWELSEAEARKAIPILDALESASTTSPTEMPPQAHTTANAPTPTPAPQPKAEPAPAEDTLIECTVVDNVVVPAYASKAPKAVLNSALKAYGFKWDPDQDRFETYKKDGKRKDGTTYRKGEHKRGAWVLMKGQRRDIAGTVAWANENLDEDGTFTAKAADIELERQKIADREARRQARKG